MGKGFNNYMCKKFFHPASRDNLKRVWMAEQKADSYKKKQEELRVQYEKEQDLYTNKAMLSKESKDKLSVNFMYEPPPGTKKEREREDDEPEYKFEWQRKFNAPREDYCKGDSEIRDQPFGIQVRNVRCIKCHKWGHINTDKECPMYNQSSSADQAGCSLDPILLIQQMREDGLAMKKSALGLHHHFPPANNLIESDEDNDDKLKESEIELLKSLTKKQKQKLLKKFKKLERKEKGNKVTKKKKKKKSKHQSSDDESISNSSSECEKERKKRHKIKKIHIKQEKEDWRDNHKPSRVFIKKEKVSTSDSGSEIADQRRMQYLAEEYRRSKKSVPHQNGKHKSSRDGEQRHEHRKRRSSSSTDNHRHRNSSHDGKRAKRS